MSNYYSEHNEEYILNTKDADMSNLYSLFLKHLNNVGKIMDLGFGSGRDSLYFKNKGYEVYSIDPTPEFCENGRRIGLDNVVLLRAQDIDYNDEFYGIWACASLLHIPSNELNDVFKRCYKALKDNGVMYCSFKYGDFEGLRNGRLFLDLNEVSFNKYIKDTLFKIIEIKITEDVRPDRDEKWLNVILKK